MGDQYRFPPSAFCRWPYSPHNQGFPQDLGLYDRKNGPMTLRGAAVLAVFVTFLDSTGCASIAELQPGQRARIRVGERVAVRAKPDRHYAVNSAGSSLIFIKQTETHGTTIYVYRAEEPGNQTFVLTPR